MVTIANAGCPDCLQCGDFNCRNVDSYHNLISTATIRDGGMPLWEDLYGQTAVRDACRGYSLATATFGRSVAYPNKPIRLIVPFAPGITEVLVAREVNTWKDVAKKTNIAAE